jgi:nucleotide-binding universal stress UspA family protein
MRRLVAYDGSPSSRRALQHAARLHQIGDHLGLVNVVERRSEPNHRLDEAQKSMADIGIETFPIEMVGSPAQEICVAAERHGYDTIVVGRRNHPDARQVLLGSVAARVVAGAPGNVLVVA